MKSGRILNAPGLLVAILALASAAFAQAQTPVPTPADDGVVKISTNLIQFDVTVTDSNGRVVRDLRREDFEVYENGRAQSVSGFSFVSNSATQAAAKSDVPPPPPASVVPRPENVRRTIALVVDDLALSFESVIEVRRALRKFVDEQMRDGDLVAIIRTGAGMGALQQFTSDKRVLYSAIDKVEWNSLGRAGVSAFTPFDEKARLNREIEAAKEKRENSANAFEDFRNSIFATGTLGALRYIINGMSELPGRKSVVMFSDGFQLYERDEKGRTVNARILEFLRQIIDLANRNSVVFYTIDARGLQTAAFTAGDSVNGEPNSSFAALQQRSGELARTQEGLRFLARETGGFSIVNGNDLAGGVRKVMDDQSYYLLAYQPDDETFDAKNKRFNKIEIKVRGRSGLTVRYRSGFYNIAERRADGPSKGATPAEQLAYAIASPFGVSDITLRLAAVFGNAKPGSYVRALVHIDAAGLKFSDEADGTKRAQFQIYAVAFGEDGLAVDQISEAYTAKIGASELDKVRRDGFIYSFTLPVKDAGAYQFRVAIRDTTDARLGSASQFVEVPNLKRERLTLSGVVLENMSPAQYQGAAPASTNPIGDTTRRTFRRGTVLQYGFDVYNARADAAKKPGLTMKVRLFHGEKMILDGRPQEISVDGQTDPARWKISGVISLVRQMEPGEYVMQIIVTDANAKEDRGTATQFVQFQVTDETK